MASTGWTIYCPYTGVSGCVKLPLSEYSEVVRKIPILCVDGIIQNEKGQYLLVKRKNEPFKGQWWVPGGRVLKGETVEEAFRRKMMEELGIAVKIIGPAGYYENGSLKSPWTGRDEIHCVSIVFFATPLSLDIKLDDQSLEWGLFDNLPTELEKMKRFGCRL